MNANLAIKWWWKFGKPADIWMEHHQMIGELIKKFDLQAVPVEHLSGHEMSALGMAKGEKAAAAIRDLSIRGGIRLPHLHYKGETYLLNQKQWQTFTEKVVEDFKNKLVNAKRVSVEQVIEVSESLNSLI
jgi:hypothetical protein